MNIFNPEKLDYSILRESKIVNFTDIDEVEEETTYLIIFNKTLENDKSYYIETPLTYFRIPEDVINKYKEDQIRKDLNSFLMETKSKILFQKII